VVLGVSPDSVKSHQNFKDKFDLPFPLISDEAKEVAQAYGAWREKKMYGKTRMGIVRSTFIIDGEGKISKAYDSVKVAGHVDDVIASL
jgi:peroxiredoxin Q/BCP